MKNQNNFIDEEKNSGIPGSRSKATPRLSAAPVLAKLSTVQTS